MGSGDPVLGWDLGTGHPVPLSRQLVAGQYVQPVLVSGNETGGAGASDPVHFDIWNLHPLVMAFLSIHRRPRPEVVLVGEGGEDNGLANRDRLTATVEAWNLVKVDGTGVPTSRIDATVLFSNGGVLDATSDEGAEIRTGSMGVRIIVRATQTDPSALEIVASLLVMQESAIGCLSLADVIKERIYVEWPKAPERIVLDEE
jgi:hypothetical protein